jgi:hypothetical protein
MLNRIAAAQNYTTKEGFSMRRVTFKALAVGLVLVTALGPIGSFGLRDMTVQAQQGQQMVLAPPWPIYTYRADSERGRHDKPTPEVRAEASATPAGGSSVVRGDTDRVLAKENRARANTVVVLGGVFTPQQAGVYRFTFRYNYNGTVRITTAGNYKFSALAALTAAVGDVSSATETLFFRGNRGDISNELLQAALGIAQGAISAILGGGNVAGVVSPTFQAIQRALQLFDSNRFEQALSGTSQLQVSATLPANQPVRVYTMFHSGISVKATRGSMASATIEMPQLQLLDVSVEFLGPSVPPPPTQLITLIINSRTQGGTPLMEPVRLIIRQPGAACPQPMGQCPGDQTLDILAAGYTLQLPANTLIQLQALPSGRAFTAWVRQIWVGGTNNFGWQPVSRDTLNPVMYSLLPCWGANPCSGSGDPNRLSIVAEYSN